MTIRKQVGYTKARDRNIKDGCKSKSHTRPKNETVQEAADRLGCIVNAKMDKNPEIPLYKVRSYYWIAVKRLTDKGYGKDFYEMADEYGWRR